MYIFYVIYITIMIRLLLQLMITKLRLLLQLMITKLMILDTSNSIFCDLSDFII